MKIFRNQKLYAVVCVVSFVAALVSGLRSTSLDPFIPASMHFEYENIARGMTVLCAISTILLARVQESVYSPWIRGIRKTDEREASIRNASFERAYTFFPLLAYFTFYWADVSPSYSDLVPLKLWLLAIMFFGLPQIFASFRK